MSASLVGSEMCIRDSQPARVPSQLAPTHELHLCCRVEPRSFRLRSCAGLAGGAPRPCRKRW
eukprot:6990303-Alexandrium_andersonii.AAC.1